VKINTARSIVVLVAVAVAMQLGNRPTYGQAGGPSCFRPGGPLSFAFETIDVPGATLTSADGISTHAISGEFDDAAGKHGFVLSGGAFTPFDVPGASFTQVIGINAKGEQSGNYVDPLDVKVIQHGFFRSQDGHVTVVDPETSRRTSVGNPNAQAQVVGVFRDSLYATPDGKQQRRRGFVWQAGVFMFFDEPLADLQPGPFGTVPFGINDRGQIVGDYVNKNDHLRHGFLRSGGVYTTIDPPDAVLTVAEGINNSGDIAGVYIDRCDNHHGFVLKAGVYTTVDVDVPGTLSTEIYSINALGEIVGQYVDGSGVFHGFVGRPPQ